MSRGRGALVNAKGLIKPANNIAIAGSPCRNGDRENGLPGEIESAGTAAPLPLASHQWLVENRDAAPDAHWMPVVSELAAFE